MMEPKVRSYAAWNRFEALGLMVSIAMHSGYSDMTINEIQEYLIPPLNANMFKIYIDAQERPCAFVTWALVNDQCHQELLEHGRNPPPYLWQSGDNLWFTDIVAPFGDALNVIRDLQRNIFPDSHAHSIKRNSDGSVNRIKVWRNALSSRKFI